MKGIVLAAGKGTRLYPMTLPVCKPLLPVYDKPLIYYPVSTLIAMGIDDILVIIQPGEEETFEALLGDGSHLGIHIEYEVQPVARGIADAFIIGKEFIGDDRVCLALGDNIFYGPEFYNKVNSAKEKLDGAVVFGCWVEDPTPFGVVEFDENGRAISIEEKPKLPKSNYIIPGLYLYDNQVVEIAENLKPSARGELEITDVNLEYLKRDCLDVVHFERGLTWLDAGSADSLLEAAEVVKALQMGGEYVGCIEEIAWRNGFIDDGQLLECADKLGKTRYSSYMKSLIRK